MVDIALPRKSDVAFRRGLQHSHVDARGQEQMEGRRWLPGFEEGIPHAGGTVMHRRAGCSLTGHGPVAAF